MRARRSVYALCAVGSFCAAPGPASASEQQPNTSRDLVVAERGKSTPATNRNLKAPNSGARVKQYFNPKELTIDKPVPWQKRK